MKKAFTLIEVLISVLIISVAIVYVFKIYENTQNEILFITRHSVSSYEDSLFLNGGNERDNRKTNAYETLRNLFKFHNDDIVSSLKSVERTVTITHIPLDTDGFDEDNGMLFQNVQFTRFRLKGSFSSEYFGFGM